MKDEEATIDTVEIIIPFEHDDEVSAMRLNRRIVKCLTPTLRVGGSFDDPGEEHEADRHMFTGCLFFCYFSLDKQRKVG